MFYTTEEQVIAQVKARYAGVGELSVDPVRYICIYSPAANGVGCAIGCLIDPSDAEKWDTYERKGIRAIAYTYPEEYAKYFPIELVDFLGSVQDAHDLASCVRGFLERLRLVSECRG